MSLKMEEKDCKIDCDQSTVVVDHLCCKICYEPYQENGEKEPKVMKCGHSICLNCVGMIYKKHSHIKCPFCKRVDHVRPNTLPKNFDMVCMIPHYPKLPPNHKPHHMEIEKMTAQWKAEKAFVAQLRLNSEEAQRLVVQTQRCLAGLSTHADAITTQMNNAESALKATEDSLRLFIDLHKKDPILVSLSEQLPKVTEEKRASVPEMIRQIKAANNRSQSRSRFLENNQSRSGNYDRSGLVQEILNSVPTIDPDGPPPPPPRLRRSPLEEPPQPPPATNSFTRSIAEAASHMHRANNPQSDWSEDILGSTSTNSNLEQQQQANYSPRQMMLNLIRGGGH